MTIRKTASIFTASALALAVAGAAQAYTFEVDDTAVNIYGYAKLDMIYDVDANLGNLANRHAIRLDGDRGSNGDGHTTLHANQSRLGFSTSTPVGGSVLKTTIEGDFWGDTFRMRHAFGEWNGVLAGQTWSNFGGLLALTPTVDFNPAPGIGAGNRQSQLRYTVDGFSIALEDPDKLGGKITNAYSANGLPSVAPGYKNRLPDLTMRYQGNAGNLKYAVSGMMREVRYHHVATGKDSAFGWGIALEANAQLTPAIVVRGGLTHGDGIGSYLEGGPSAPAYVDPVTGDLETIESTGGIASISVAAGPGTMTLGYGITTADLDDAARDNVPGAADASDKFEAVHLNYIWSPIRNITYGIELGYHTREVQDGRDGDAMRFQGMVRYNF